MAKSSQKELNRDTSETSSSEGEEDDSKTSIKSSIEKIYSKLEGLTFQGAFENFVLMTQFRRLEPSSRPVYEVTDKSTNELLGKVYDNMIALNKEVGGKEIWKGITRDAYGLRYKLWGSEQSVGYTNSGTYHIPVGGIDVIISDTLMKYQAIVNITVLSEQ